MASQLKRSPILQAESGRLNDRPCARQERSAGFIRRISKSNPKLDRSVFGVRVFFEDLAAFNKSEISVQLVLEQDLVGGALGPIQVIANRENDVPGDTIRAHDIYDVELFYRQASLEKTRLVAACPPIT